MSNDNIDHTVLDFDDENVVERTKHQTVEITVGLLDVLLSYYYTGGGEPDSKKERLQEAIKIANG